MEKVMYLCWGDPANGDSLREALLAEGVPSLAERGARRISFDVHDGAAAAAPSPVPTPAGEQPHVAVVSTWVDSYDRSTRVGEAVAALAAGHGATTAGYLVCESLYDDYGTTPHAGPRDWPDGTRSPGVLTVALIHRPAGLDYAEWIRRWHSTQSPVSAELQPRTRYVRNEVVRALDDGAPEIHGIVEEAWPSVQHVADPMLFFNAGDDRAVLSANIERMLESVNACLDLGRLRNMTMSEYLCRT